MPKHPYNVPLASTAAIKPKEDWLLGIYKDGQIEFVFPKGTPYARVRKVAKLMHGEVYRVKARVSYELLEANELYDHSPLITRR